MERSKNDLKSTARVRKFQRDTLWLFTSEKVLLCPTVIQKSTNLSIWKLRRQERKSLIFKIDWEVYLQDCFLQNVPWTFEIHRRSKDRKTKARQRTLKENPHACPTWSHENLYTAKSLRSREAHWQIAKLFVNDQRPGWNPAVKQCRKRACIQSGHYDNFLISNHQPTWYK